MLNLLNDKLQLYSNECKMELDTTSFLLSFSGGMDSTIMASLLLGMRDRYNFKLGFAHINHHAHTKSKHVEQFCVRYAHDNNVLFHLHELFIDTQRNFEACAREKRYAILQEIAEKYKYHFILTAHHQDDQLETVYMKKMDGGDWISQIGIRERLGIVRRPFLEVTKKEIKAYGKQHHIMWVEDPTNINLAIRRNNIRHQLLPKACKVDAGLKESLLNIAKNNLIKLHDTALKFKQKQDTIIKGYRQNYIQICRSELKNYNLEELKLFIYIYIGKLLNVKLTHQTGGLWKEFKNFIKHSKTGSIFQINILTFIINRDEILAINHFTNMRTNKKLRLCHNLLWYLGQFKTRDQCAVNELTSKYKFRVPYSLYKAGLYIRTWKHGDRMLAATSQKHVLLSDLYINSKLSKYDKITQPVVVDSNDMILWIPSLLHGKINFDKKDKVRIINWAKG